MLQLSNRGDPILSSQKKDLYRREVKGRRCFLQGTELIQFLARQLFWPGRVEEQADLHPILQLVLTFSSVKILFSTYDYQDRVLYCMYCIRYVQYVQCLPIQISLQYCMWMLGGGGGGGLKYYSSIGICLRLILFVGLYHR